MTTTPTNETATRVRRVFTFNGTQLQDPDPSKSPDEVRKHYASQFPALTSGTVTGPEEKDGRQIYTFKASVGTKG